MLFLLCFLNNRKILNLGSATFLSIVAIKM
jgi:hypothetical protein